MKNLLDVYIRFIFKHDAAFCQKNSRSYSFDAFSLKNISDTTFEPIFLSLTYELVKKDSLSFRFGETFVLIMFRLFWQETLLVYTNI